MSKIDLFFPSILFKICQFKYLILKKNIWKTSLRQLLRNTESSRRKEVVIETVKNRSDFKWLCEGYNSKVAWRKVFGGNFSEREEKEKFRA